MGLLRFLLALSVIIAHTGPLAGFSLVGGPAAVQVFFMISGFYMAMILEGKYRKENSVSYALFYTNRMLRIYPPYLVMLLLTFFFFIFCVTTGNIPVQFTAMAQYASQLKPINILFLLITNTFIFGQDLVMFMGVNTTTGSLFFTSNFWRTTPGLYNFLFISQAWSISLELTFYLLAPFLTRLRNSTILGIMLLSLILRQIFYARGYNFDPWTYRVFLFEIIFFLAGILAFRIYNEWKGRISQRMAMRATALLLVTVFYYSFAPQLGELKKTIFLLLAWSVLPLVFFATKNNKLDRFIGELSYPLYISHLFVISVLEYFHLGQNAQQIPHASLYTLIFSVIISLCLHFFINKPIDAWRQRRLAQS